MAVLRPLKLVIENYPEGQVEEIEAVNNPEDAAAGTRQVPFSRELFIERDDFREDPPKKFHRLSPGTEVRLRWAYFIRCTAVVKDAAGEIVELRCTYDAATGRSAATADGRKVKGTIHWVSAAHAVDAEVRLYDRLFTAPDPENAPEGQDFTASLNPAALEVMPRREGGAERGRRRGRRALPVRAHGLLLRRPRQRARAACVQPHRGPARHVGEDRGQVRRGR